MNNHITLKILSAALGLSAFALSASASVTVVKNGLNNPRGIAVGANGRVFFAETGTGTIYQINGSSVKPFATGFPFEISPEEEITGVVNVALTGNGNVFALVGEGSGSSPPWSSIYRINGSGKKTPLASIADFQVGNPDPEDKDNFPEESNPYGLAVHGTETILVTDAANNDLLFVNDDGTIEQIARFGLRFVDAGGIGLPGVNIPAEAVPTTVAIGPDGYYYVGQLLGFPFTPGESMIWRIAPWARGAVCDSDESDGCETYLTGFSSIIDLDFGPDGSLYVLEMAKSGLLGLFFGYDPLGALIKIKDGVRTQISTGRIPLVAPGGIAVDRSGAIWLTNFSIMQGSGQVLKID